MHYDNFIKELRQKRSREIFVAKIEVEIQKMRDSVGLKAVNYDSVSVSSSKADDKLTEVIGETMRLEKLKVMNNIKISFVNAVLNCFTEEDRKLLVMIHCHRLKNSHIAKEFNCCEKTIKRNKANLESRLRGLFDE